MRINLHLLKWFFVKINLIPMIKEKRSLKLLLGLDDFELLELKRELKEKKADHRDLSTRLSQIFDILGSADNNITLKNIRAEIQSYEENKRQLEDQINSFLENEDRFKEHTKEAKKRA